MHGPGARSELTPRLRGAAAKPFACTRREERVHGCQERNVVRATSERAPPALRHWEARPLCKQPHRHLYSAAPRCRPSPSCTPAPAPARERRRGERPTAQLCPREPGVEGPRGDLLGQPLCASTHGRNRCSGRMCTLYSQVGSVQP